MRTVDWNYLLFELPIEELSQMVLADLLQLFLELIQERDVELIHVHLLIEIYLHSLEGSQLLNQLPRVNVALVGVFPFKEKSLESLQLNLILGGLEEGNELSKVGDHEQLLQEGVDVAGASIVLHSSVLVLEASLNRDIAPRLYGISSSLQALKLLEKHPGDRGRVLLLESHGVEDEHYIGHQLRFLIQLYLHLMGVVEDNAFHHKQYRFEDDLVLNCKCSDDLQAEANKEGKELLVIDGFIGEDRMNQLVDDGHFLIALEE